MEANTNGSAESFKTEVSGHCRGMVRVCMLLIEVYAIACNIHVENMTIMCVLLAYYLMVYLCRTDFRPEEIALLKL